MTHETVTVVPVKKADRQKEADNGLVFSYLALRNLVGISGMILPLVLVLATNRAEGDKRIENSISEYYYTSNGDVLVVLLSVLGVFLFTYNGYNWKEKFLTTLAAICGIGVAFSPTATDSASPNSIHFARQTVPMVLGIERHFLFAGTFFIALALICLLYFPRTDKHFLTTMEGKLTPKAKRNFMYYACGWTMIGCVAVLAGYFMIKPDLDEIPVVLIFETIAIEAFGISWITKGETLWPDGEHYIKKGFRDIRERLK